MEKKHAMAATDGQILVAAARWSAEEVLSLRDYLAQVEAAAANNQQHHPARTEVVKLVRGQHAGLGVPNLPNPSLQPHALLASFGKTLKVAAQGVKFKEGKRHAAVASGARFSIPESYPGFFEILSEEGKAVRCIESVLELAKKFPESVLVREAVRAVVTTSPLAEASPDKSRTVAAGEILALKKEVTLTARTRSNRFLQCVDSRGDLVYLNLEQRGRFSPVARNDNISGVHSLRQLVSNKRLPLMVRLVWGPPPFKGTSPCPLPTELRLFATFEEASAFALPLGHAPRDVVALPLGCNLKLVRARNLQELRQTEQFQRLAGAAVRAANELRSRMTVLDTFKDSIHFWNISPGHSKYVAGAKASAKSYFLRRSVSHDGHAPGPQLISEATTPDAAPTQDFLEIDQIYDYVRGFAPLPKSLRSGASPDKQPPQQQQKPSEKAPKPPPIETIPTNKLNGSKQRTPKDNKTKSKTALKMEMHAQNVAHESLKAKRLFKSKTTSSIADHVYLSPEPESPRPNDTKPVLDLSSTHLLTQADLVPHRTDESANDSDEDPTYENTTQVYLEEKKSGRRYAKQRAASEIGPTESTSPYRKNVSVESSRHLIVRGKQRRSNAGADCKTSKSHEDLATKCQSQPESPSSSPEQQPLYNSLNSLANVRTTPPSTSEERRRHHLGKQRSLSSLLAEASPHTPVIEHKPVELHLHLSRHANQKHHAKSKATGKLGIMYL